MEKLCLYNEIGGHKILGVYTSGYMSKLFEVLPDTKRTPTSGATWTTRYKYIHLLLFRWLSTFDHEMGSEISEGIYDWLPSIYKSICVPGLKSQWYRPTCIDRCCLQWNAWVPPILQLRQKECPASLFSGKYILIEAYVHVNLLSSTEEYLFPPAINCNKCHQRHFDENKQCYKHIILVLLG